MTEIEQKVIDTLKRECASFNILRYIESKVDNGLEYGQLAVYFLDESCEPEEQEFKKYDRRFYPILHVSTGAGLMINDQLVEIVKKDTRQFFKLLEFAVAQYAKKTAEHTIIPYSNIGNLGKAYVHDRLDRMMWAIEAKRCVPDKILMKKSFYDSITKLCGEPLEQCYNLPVQSIVPEYCKFDAFVVPEGRYLGCCGIDHISEYKRDNGAEDLLLITGHTVILNPQFLIGLVNENLCNISVK